MSEKKETMTVKVRDRRLESNYDYGPHFKTIEIRNVCPRCGGPRGEVEIMRFAEDGDFFWVNTWKNPCGHVDTYAEVLQESGVRP